MLLLVQSHLLHVNVEVKLQLGGVMQPDVSYIYPVSDYFPLTKHPDVLYSSYTPYICQDVWIFIEG